MPITTTKRKPIPKKIRTEIYLKYQGHCAYCGCELAYKDMQVDHLVPLYWHGGEESIDNYMPACRMCNFYKSTLPLEKFREQLQTLHVRIEKNFIYRIAKRYGMVVERKEPIQFYFEREEIWKNQNKPGNYH